MADQQPQIPATTDELRALFLTLAHNPKTRASIAKAIKEVAPESPHARAFGDVEIADQFEAFKREQDEERLKRRGEEQLERMNRQRASLLSGDGGRTYSEDDVKKIEALMEKKGIVDYNDGATLYAATLPPPDPKPSDIPIRHGSTWEFPEFEKFATNPTKAANEVAHSMISDFMRKR